MKIVSLAIVLLAASAAPPSSAKEAHVLGHHAGVLAASASKVTTSKGADTRTNSDNAKPNESIDMGMAAPVRPSILAPHKGRELKPSLKIARPENFDARRPELFLPAARNAIGMRIAQPDNMTNGAERFGSTVPAPGATFGGVERPYLGEENIGRLNSLLLPSASFPGRSKIIDAGVIRPTPRPVAIGGPARPVGGINGTSFRSKH